MFLKYKTKRALKKISSGAPAPEIKSAVSSVVKEATRQFSRQISKLEKQVR